MKATSHQNRRLIVHAGMHKTGTTAIQNYLFHHLDDARVRYLSAGRPNSTLLIRQAFDSRFDDKLQSQQRRDALTRLADLAQQDVAVAVLSAEGICALDDEDLRRFFEFFRPYYPQIDVHLYMRPLKSRVESVFQQRLQDGFHSPEQTVRIDYLGNLERFAGVFGAPQVHYHRYARDDFPGGSVVRHFLQTLGIEQVAADPADRNQSLTLPAVQLLYAYRRHFPQRDAADMERIERLKQLPGTRFHFHSQLYQRVLEMDPERMRRFEAHAGFSLTEDEQRYDDIGIHGEADLLLPDWAALQWLQSAAGADALAGDATAIAAQVRALA